MNQEQVGLTVLAVVIAAVVLFVLARRNRTADVCADDCRPLDVNPPKAEISKPALVPPKPKRVRKTTKKTV